MKNIALVKNFALVMAGLFILLFAAICPLPTMLAISGMAWRAIIGVLGCFSLVSGIYRTTHKR